MIHYTVLLYILYSIIHFCSLFITFFIQHCKGLSTQHTDRIKTWYQITTLHCIASHCIASSIAHRVASISYWHQINHLHRVNKSIYPLQSRIIHLRKYHMNVTTHRLHIIMCMYILCDRRAKMMNHSTQVSGSNTRMTKYNNVRILDSIWGSILLPLLSLFLKNS